MADAPNTPTEKPGEDGRGVVRWAAVYEAMTGATAPGGHHEQKPGVHADSLVAGHEPDRYDAKGIVMVPVLVVVVAGLTYLLVTGLFAFLDPGSPKLGGNADAVAANTRPYNDRIKGIDSSDPNAKVPQPRLEYMKVLDQRKMSNGQLEPEYVRSFRAADTKENSPEIYPQDLYPDRYTDHVTGKKVLAEYDWVSKEKGVARIPVDQAAKLVLGQLKAKKDTKVTASTIDRPKISNGGQTVPAAAPKAEEKKPDAHDDHKKDAPKPAPEKKDAPKPPTPEKK